MSPYKKSKHCQVALGVGKLWSTQFVANLELHIMSKVATHKISLTLNNFKDHI